MTNFEVIYLFILISEIEQSIAIKEFYKKNSISNSYIKAV